MIHYAITAHLPKIQTSVTETVKFSNMTHIILIIIKFIMCK